MKGIMRIYGVTTMLALALTLPFVRSGGGQTQALPNCSTITAENLDDCVRLNQLQVLGTHNSYHIAPAPAVLALLGPGARDVEYSHRPLEQQLSSLGVRKLEIDVFADPAAVASHGRLRSHWSKDSTRWDENCSSPASKCCTRRISTFEPRAQP